MNALDQLDQFVPVRVKGSVVTSATSDVPQKSVEYRLFQSCSRGSILVAKAILGDVSDIDCNHLVNGMNAAHICSKKGFAELLEVLFDKFPKFFESRTEDGRTCAMIAAYEGQLAIVELISKRREQSQVDALQVVDNRGNSVLHHAAWGGSFEVVRYLVEDCKLSPISNNLEDIPPIQMAAAGNFSDIVRLLSERMISIENAQNYMDESKSGVNSIIRACSHGSLDAVRVLLEYNLENIHSRSSENGSGLLQYAAQHGYDQIVEYLLSFKLLEVDNRNNYGLTALHYACIG
jgi:ankyrin repeat protein